MTRGTLLLPGARHHRFVSDAQIDWQHARIDENEETHNRFWLFDSITT